MKRLIAFILLVIPLFMLLFLKQEKRDVLCDFNIIKACIVTKDDIKTKNALNSLDYNYVFVEKDEIKKVLKEVTVKGIELYLKDESLDKICKSLNMLVFKKEKIENKEIIYGYTPKYDDYVLVENKRINTQICIENGDITIGFPMIMTGF